MNIETIKSYACAIINCGNGYFRELNKTEYKNSVEFALAVIDCAKHYPMGDYWDSKEGSYKEIKFKWQDRIVLYGVGAKMNIQNISLNETGTEKFNQWFADVAKECVRMDAVMLDALNIIENRAAMGESLSYELGQQFTNTGRPELLILAPEDIEITILKTGEN